MLTNTVIKVTFGDLRAQQISAIIFQCGVLYHTEFDFLWLFIYLSSRKNGFKYPALLINIFIFKRKPNLDLLYWTRYVSICSIYFICQKSSHRFLPIFFSVIEDVVLIEFIKLKVGVTVLVLKKTSIYLAIELSLREISYVLCARAHLHALMTQTSCAVRMRNAKLGNHLKKRLNIQPTNRIAKKNREKLNSFSLSQSYSVRTPKRNM